MYESQEEVLITGAEDTKPKKKKGCCTCCAYMWYSKWSSPSRKITAAVSFFFTLLVLTVEVLPIFLGQNWMDTSLWERPLGTSFLAVNLICMPIITYMCLGCNFGIFYMGFGAYAINGNNLTDPMSLCQSGRFVLTFSIALAYNFTGVCGITDCAFFTVMGPLQSISFLGTGFNLYVYPAVLYAMVFITITRCYERLCHCCGK